MRRILTWIIALLYVLFGGWLTLAMPRLKLIINELFEGEQIEYSFSNLCLLSSPSWAWLPLSAVCAWGVLVCGFRGKGPWRNILLALPLFVAVLFWLLSIKSIFFPWIVTIQSLETQPYRTSKKRQSTEPALSGYRRSASGSA